MRLKWWWYPNTLYPLSTSLNSLPPGILHVPLSLYSSLAFIHPFVHSFSKYFLSGWGSRCWGYHGEQESRSLPWRILYSGGQRQIIDSLYFEKKKKMTFIHSIKYLLNTYFVPDTVLGVGDIVLRQTQSSNLQCFPFSGETMNKWIRKFRHGKCLKKMKQGHVPGVKREGKGYCFNQGGQVSVISRDYKLQW